MKGEGMPAIHNTPCQYCGKLQLRASRQLIITCFSCKMSRLSARQSKKKSYNTIAR